MKRLIDLYDIAQASSRSEFIHAHPFPVLVVLQVHEGNLVHRPPDHEATVSHRRLPWADPGAVSARPNRRRSSLGVAARATMFHEGDEDPHINLNALFDDSPGPKLPKLNSRSRFVTLRSNNTGYNPQLLIGRSSNCDVVINDYSVSKSHAQFNHDVQLKRTMVTDMGSRNGTFMDEHRLEKGRPALIRSGDEIRLGRLNFVYLEPSDLYTALVPDAES